MTTTTSITFDADILSAADRGELYRVEKGEAYLLSRSSIPESDGCYGMDWILVRASSAKKAVETAIAYDSTDSSVRVRHVAGELMAVVLED